MPDSNSSREWMESFEQRGFALVAQALTAEQVRATTAKLHRALEAHADEKSIRSRGGRIYAARNLLDVFPEAADVCFESSRLTALLRELLGETGGLVRGLFFDKPPDQPWSLPWHQDRTIAVRDNRLPTAQFCNPTRKADVPHVEAPCSLLRRMVTVRIHLDQAGADNGALRVLPGTHCRDDWQPSDDGGGEIGQLIEAAAGDALFMRPLLAHCSGVSEVACDRHRRILHLELAPEPELPDGYQWRTFLPLEGD